MQKILWGELNHVLDLLQAAADNPDHLRSFVEQLSEEPAHLLKKKYPAFHRREPKWNTLQKQAYQLLLVLTDIATTGHFDRQKCEIALLRYLYERAGIEEYRADQNRSTGGKNTAEAKAAANEKKKENIQADWLNCRQSHDEHEIPGILAEKHHMSHRQMLRYRPNKKEDIS